MTLTELIEATKELAADRRGGGLWSREALARYLNEGEREAAARARLILDLETSVDESDPALPVCNYTVAQGDATITLHPKILFVRRVMLGSSPVPLAPTHIRDMDRVAPGWERASAGSVLTYIPNWSKGKLRFYNKFGAADTVNLQVIRLPLADMVADTDQPEIDSQWHMGLPHWALYRAFMKPDPDTKDKVKSKDHYDLFEQIFGPRSSAIDQTWIQREHGYDDNEGLF